MASNMHWMIFFCRSIEQHAAKLAVGASVGELDRAVDDGDTVGEPVEGEAVGELDGAA
eukprot:CAMPEP_0114244124 /NCGR_PEP_ID=MMETSP0058-20121206/11166_1 /TAXON_ID=36894 /ORGANISM="Pyramimonas parkeae, CCMP726" /LENGTH=57 /DNA_ID=CAMNT_0001357031 /DNA_START=283 /DNA_END=453 /DNA_ORIENTATION=+